MNQTQTIYVRRPANPDAVKVQERNKAYYAKFPEDVERVKDILDHLKANKVLLPSNGTLTPARFQQLGIFLGMHGTYVYIRILCHTLDRILPNVSQAV